MSSECFLLDNFNHLLTDMPMILTTLDLGGHKEAERRASHSYREYRNGSVPCRQCSAAGPGRGSQQEGACTLRCWIQQPNLKASSKELGCQQTTWVLVCQSGRDYPGPSATTYITGWD